MSNKYSPAAPDLAPTRRSVNVQSVGASQVPGPRPGNAQWIGARQEQQDAFGFAGFDERGQASGEAVLAVVADGMGGLTGGRAASQAAVSAFLAAWNARPAQQPITESLLSAIEAANRTVHQLACATAGEGEVGTTLVAVVVAGNRLHWIAAGDSRIYWYRAADGSLTPCNEEHNLALRLWRQAPDSGMSRSEIDRHPDRDLLISFLGLAEIPEIDRNVRPLTLQPGDRLLLCSDGVDGTLTLDDLSALLAADPQRAAEGIIALVQARKRPHQDNATVAILAFDAPPLAPAVAPMSDPPTRRRSAEPSSPPPASKKAKALILGSGGLILATLLGIAGWYIWQGHSQQDPAEIVSLPIPKIASPSAEQTSESDTQPRRTEQETQEGQGRGPQATASTPDEAQSSDETGESASDGSKARPPESSITPDTKGEGEQAESPSARSASDSANNLQPSVPSAAAPPAHDSRGQSNVEGAGARGNAGEKPAGIPQNPLQPPPGPGWYPPNPYSR